MEFSQSDILSYLDKYKSVRSDRPARDLSIVHSDTTVLIHFVKKWRNELQTILAELEDSSMDSLQSKAMTNELRAIVAGAEIILSMAKAVKAITVTMDVEPSRLLVEKEIMNSLSILDKLLREYDSRRGQQITGEHVVDDAAKSISSAINKSRTVERRLKRFNKVDSAKRHVAVRTVAWFFGGRVQFGLVIIALLAMIFFAIVDSPMEQEFHSMKAYARVFSVSVAVLWFQATFAFPGKENPSWLFRFMFWATINNIWIYGLLLGIVISLLVYILPLGWLLSISKNLDDKSVPERIFARFLAPYAVAWLFVALVLTHELIWVIGLVIWLTFNIFIRQTSYRFFRQNYDLIEDIVPGRTGRRLRESQFLLSSAITVALVLSGVLGVLDVADISLVFGFAADFSLILITILLAVQAIIPGINIWSRDENAKQRIREMRLMLRANRGLGGFMRSFFVLFVFANAVRLLVASYDGDPSLYAPLDMRFLTTVTGNIFDIVMVGAEYSVEITVQALITTLFVICVSLLTYCVTLLFYMFSTASTFLVPIQDTLMSTPPFVENVSNVLLEGNVDRQRVEELVVDAIKSCNKLNGCIVNQVSLIESPAVEGKIIVTVEYHIDFPDKSEMYRIVKDTHGLLFDRTKDLSPLIDRIGVNFFQHTHDLGKHNIFALQIDEEEWKFLKKDIPGMTFQFKIENVFNAKLVGYVLPESQIS